jgi:ATP-binding cassette, subfamily B, multidrug efflux pump
MTALRRLLQYVAPYRRTLALGVLCVLAANLLKAAAPRLLQQALDGLAADVGPARPLHYGILLVLIGLGQAVFTFAQGALLTAVSRDVEADLRRGFYEHLQRMPLEFYQGQRTGDLMARATNDTRAASLGLGSALSTLIDTVFAAALIVPLMVGLNWRLTLLSFLPLPLMAVAAHLSHERLRDRFEKVQEHFGAVSNRAHEALAGVRTIRAYAQEPAQVAGFREASRLYYHHNLRLLRLWAGFVPAGHFLLSLGFVAVFWYGGRLVTQGALTIGEFVGFSLYLGYLASPISDLGWTLSLLQQARAAMGRIHAVLSQAPSITDRPQPHPVDAIRGSIEFKDLTFHYHRGDPPALQGISLRIEPGQTVGLVGAVGSGKTTLLNLVPRLLDAPPGQLLIDGHAAADLPLATLRSAIAYVPQETFLFSDTIAANIAFGSPGAPREAVERAADAAGLAEDIAELPGGYDTVLGERGITLSGGSMPA